MTARAETFGLLLELLCDLRIIYLDKYTKYVDVDGQINLICECKLYAVASTCLASGIRLCSFGYMYSVFKI